MAEVSGVTGAGPIFHDTMLAAAEARPPNRDRGLLLAHDPEAKSRLGLARTAVCSLSGEIATTSCPHRVHEWLPEGSADHAPPCSVHERVHVDDETVRVVERWPPPFDEWARRTHRAVAPDEANAMVSTDGLRITYPFDGARFAIDPERRAAMQLLDVTVEPNAPDVRVVVDGAPLGGDRRWPLAAGEHVIAAQRGATSSAPVRISVH
jgi:penicillin-binding protein 1C